MKEFEIKEKYTINKQSAEINCLYKNRTKIKTLEINVCSIRHCAIQYITIMANRERTTLDTRNMAEHAGPSNILTKNAYEIQIHPNKLHTKLCELTKSKQIRSGIPPLGNNSKRQDYTQIYVKETGGGK